MKKLTSLVLALCLATTVFGQDFHFSQFYAAPTYQNPGNTGVFNGDVRAYTLYRMQWFTVATPYKTFNVAVDGPIFKNKMKGDDFFAAGVNFFNDNQGDVRMKLNSFNALVSYTKFIGGRHKHNITLGYTIGYNIKSAALGGLKYNSQYDQSTGTYNPAYGSGEPGGGAAGYMDMSTGIVWNFTTTHLFRSSLGFSFHHFTAPNTSIRGGVDLLLPKFGVQWNIGYKLSETSNTTLLPSIMAYQQGTSLLLNGGLNVKYVLEERSRYTDHQTDKAFYIGAFYRFRDAFFVTFRYDYMDFSGSLAYDVNISGLSPASKTVGGFELMLSYKGIFGKNKLSKRSSVRFM
ncbi:MAG: PorP/SprF family type IX secretion system membrane protein [Bacteroidota bacterium]|nr:PorP/SprF family type IX secretion system membrane protein [Bacteroidota bacterium]